jgi:density-regulated protein
METVPGLKLKDVAKLFGKKFASGAAVSDTATGGKEIVIQGDVNFDLVPLIIKEYKVHPRDIYFLEGTSLVRQG